MNQLTYDEFQALQVGDQLNYKAGQGNWHLEAKVTIQQTPGTTGVWVTLDKFEVKGSDVPYEQGKKIIAGTNELYR